MLADAFPERALTEPRNRRRTGIAAIVALLHLLLLYGMMHAISVHIVPKIIARVPITIWMPLPPKHEEEKKKPQPLSSSEAPAVRELKTAPITISPLPSRPRSTTDQDGLARLGRYLQNCSGGNYESLTQKEWANCLGGMATQDRNTIRLGDVKTLWEMQHPPPPGANPKDASGFGECAHNDPKRLMGLPCFQYNGEKPSVLNGQR